MNIDKMLHEIHKAFSPNGIRWHGFEEVGMNEPYYLYYYAEDELYVIRDVMLNSFWFVQARSPKQAIEKYKDRLDEAMKAGAWCEEESE